MPRTGPPVEKQQDAHPDGENVSPQEEAIPAKVYRYAERLIHQRDRDGDGSLDRLEWGRHWGFLTSDTNLDGRVTLGELVGRIATYGGHRRIRLMPPLLETDEAFPSLLNPTAEAEPAAASRVSRLADEASTNRPGEATPAGRGDNGGSGETRDRRRDTKFVVSAARRPDGLPSWFVDRDADGDGQLSMAEFAPKPTSTSLAEFSRYDRDGDGVITAGEYLRAVKSSGEEKPK